MCAIDVGISEFFQVESEYSYIVRTYSQPKPQYYLDAAGVNASFMFIYPEMRLEIPHCLVMEKDYSIV